MTAQRNLRMSATDFLDWTDSRENERFELEDGVVLEMAAERAQHASMKFAAAKALEAGIQASGLSCTVFPDGLTVVIDDRHVRLPDASVQSSPVDPASRVLEKPVVLVEVVSPSSRMRDQTFKLVEYFSLPSVEHYLVLDPERRTVIHFSRNRVAGDLTTRFLSSKTIHLDPPGFELSIEALLGPVMRSA